jgi:hypothetical protein
MGDERVEELSAEIGGQKLSLKSVALNTLATVATLIGVAVLIVLATQHQTEAKDQSNAFVAAIKEQTTAMKEQTAVAREQNCLMRFETKDRAERAEFCKQIVR